MRMTAVAIDDEPIALSIIQEYCNQYGDCDLHTFTSPVEGMRCIEASRPDIVFLDIEMNSHNGIELARELPKDTCLVFTTAYSDYAVEGFNVNAVDFLHKPIFYPRFVQAMRKCEKWLRLLRGENRECAAVADPARGRAAGTLHVKADHKTQIINLDDIIYIEAMENYVKIFRRNNPMLVTQVTMKELTSSLPLDRFARIHRSYIVSLSDVETYKLREITLRGVDKVFPLGRTYLSLFREALTLHASLKS